MFTSCSIFQTQCTKLSGREGDHWKVRLVQRHGGEGGLGGAENHKGFGVPKQDVQRGVSW